MVRELERLGMPTAMISPLTSLALSVGANRVVPGTAITHPTGDPNRPAERERALRLTILRRALESLESRLETSQVFELLAA